jgi:hypothetical protein
MLNDVLMRDIGFLLPNLYGGFGEVLSATVWQLWPGRQHLASDPTSKRYGILQLPPLSCPASAILRPRNSVRRRFCMSARTSTSQRNDALGAAHPGVSNISRKIMKSGWYRLRNFGAFGRKDLRGWCITTSHGSGGSSPMGGGANVTIIAVVAPPTSLAFFLYYEKVGSKTAYEPLEQIPDECRNIHQVQAFTLCHS